MTLELLIHSIVQQTTILIARLATSGGTRAPLAQVADQVFLHLVKELEEQGVSRRVSADMFGLGLRTYQRKIQRLSESLTDRGRSLWEAALDFVRQETMVTRMQVLTRFSRDDESQVRSVLHDLCESRLVFSSGSGPQTVFRAASEDELKTLQHIQGGEGLDELIWAMIYRLGPVRIQDIVQDTGLSVAQFEASIARLVTAGRVDESDCDGTKTYRSKSLFIPVGATVGWEAAVFDNYKAMVNTIVARVSGESTSLPDTMGGCTFTMEVWDGHPLQEKSYRALSQIRKQLSNLRNEIEEYNDAHGGVPEDHTRVSLYAGQCLIVEGSLAENQAPPSSPAPARNDEQDS